MSHPMRGFICITQKEWALSIFSMLFISWYKPWYTCDWFHIINFFISGRIVPSWVWHLSDSWRPFLWVDTLCQFILRESFVSHFILHDSKEKEVKFSTWRIYSCHQCLKCLTRSSVNFFMLVCLNVLWTDHYIS